MSIASKVAGFLQQRRLFVGMDDVMAFRRLRHQPQPSSTPAGFRMRGLGGAIQYCRPGTTDAMVLIDTFVNRYHLPPVQLRRDAVILDLGANVGYTMADFAHRFPDCRVIGYELDESNAELAGMNTRSFGSRCTVHRAAVWHKSGQIHYGGDEEWGFHVADDGEVSASKGTAPALTMDDVLKTSRLEYVDYIKMDIEGAEAFVLGGEAGWLRAVGCIKVEIHPPATVDQCMHDLANAGFNCSRDHMHPSCVVGVRSA